MAGDINQVILVGRVTRDAELRYTASGSALCAFAIAVNRRVKRGEQWEDVASFFDLTLWEKQAENLQKYLMKGTQVAIQGELRQDRWEKDGQKMSKVQVFVTNIQLIGGRRDGTPHDEMPQAGASSAPSASAHRPASEDFDPRAYEDDIPF